MEIYRCRLLLFKSRRRQWPRIKWRNGSNITSHRLCRIRAIFYRNRRFEYIGCRLARLPRIMLGPLLASVASHDSILWRLNDRSEWRNDISSQSKNTCAYRWRFHNMLIVEARKMKRRLSECWRHVRLPIARSHHLKKHFYFRREELPLWHVTVLAMSNLKLKDSLPKATFQRRHHVSMPAEREAAQTGENNISPNIWKSSLSKMHSEIMRHISSILYIIIFDLQRVMKCLKKGLFHTYNKLISRGAFPILSK